MVWICHRHLSSARRKGMSVSLQLRPLSLLLKCYEVCMLSWVFSSFIYTLEEGYSAYQGAFQSFFVEHLQDLITALLLTSYLTLISWGLSYFICKTRGLFIRLFFHLFKRLLSPYYISETVKALEWQSWVWHRTHCLWAHYSVRESGRRFVAIHWEKEFIQKSVVTGVVPSLD